MHARILVEKDADEALATENFQCFGETRFAGKQLHPEALTGMDNESVGRGIVEGAKDDAELGERGGNDEGLRGLNFPIRKVRRADQSSGGITVVLGVSLKQFGRSRDDGAEAMRAQIRGSEREQAGFDQTAEAFAGGPPMPFRRAIREGVIEVGQSEASAASEAKINRVAQGGGY